MTQLHWKPPSTPLMVQLSFAEVPLQVQKHNLSSRVKQHNNTSIASSSMFQASSLLSFLTFVTMSLKSEYEGRTIAKFAEMHLCHSNWEISENKICNNSWIHFQEVGKITTQVVFEWQLNLSHMARPPGSLMWVKSFQIKVHLYLWLIWNMQIEHSAKSAGGMAWKHPRLQIHLSSNQWLNSEGCSSNI